jgi:hypothetical protein
VHSPSRKQSAQTERSCWTESSFGEIILIVGFGIIIIHKSGRSIATYWSQFAIAWFAPIHQIKSFNPPAQRLIPISNPRSKRMDQKRSTDDHRFRKLG